MASSRKKQDERNMKTLRELASLKSNKYCFDCNQRGPTYVNVTIGTFVCTKCSGLLRGLTPPHRVKSISMATFTIEEVEFLKMHGNFFCYRTWLGLYEGKASETRDEQSLRDFMVEKYERKAYYNADAKPETETFVVSPVQTEKVVRQSKSTAEFVADFGSADIYNANDNGNFNGDKYNNNCGGNNVPSWGGLSNFVAEKPVTFPLYAQEQQAPPPLEDRYAALKDLDTVFKTQPQLDWNLGPNSSSPTSSEFSSPPSEPESSAYGSSQFPKSSNPFAPQEPPMTQQPFNPFRNRSNFYSDFAGSNPFMLGPSNSSNPFL